MHVDLTNLTILLSPSEKNVPLLSLPSKKQKQKTIFEAPHAKTEDKRHRKILLTITKLKKIIMKRYYFFFLSNISYCLIHLCEALERSIWNSFPISSHIFSEILKKNSLEYYSWKGFKVVDLNDKTKSEIWLKHFSCFHWLKLWVQKSPTYYEPFWTVIMLFYHEKNG